MNWAYKEFSPHSSTTQFSLPRNVHFHQSEVLRQVLVPYGSCEEPGMIPKSVGGKEVGNRRCPLWEIRWFWPNCCSKEDCCYKKKKALYLVYCIFRGLELCRLAKYLQQNRSWVLFICWHLPLVVIYVSLFFLTQCMRVWAK